MRDPARIEPILQLIREIWKKHPDLRLGQLLLNVCYDPHPELYYKEDDALRQALQALYLKP